MKTFLIAAICVVAAFGYAQDGKTGLSKTRSKGTVQSQDTTPVTCDEARLVFEKAQKVLASTLSQAFVQKSSVPFGTAPISRAQVVAEMTRLFNLTKPSFKFTPKAVSFDLNVIKLPDAAQLPNLRMLIRYGCIGKVSPLAVGPKNTLTVQEFGDALGFFIARIAQLTHSPTPKWSPYLGAGG